MLSRLPPPKVGRLGSTHCPSSLVFTTWRISKFIYSGFLTKPTPSAVSSFHRLEDRFVYLGSYSIAKHKIPSCPGFHQSEGMRANLFNFFHISSMCGPTSHAAQRRLPIGAGCEAWVGRTQPILFRIQLAQIVHNGLVYLIDGIYQFFMYQGLTSAELLGQFCRYFVELRKAQILGNAL